MVNHYNFIFDSISNTYNFITRHNILYRVAFVVDETFSSISQEQISNIYQLVVEKANKNIEPLDVKVSVTIEKIIEQFFEKIENSLIYICSFEEEKSKLRHEVFERWYRKSKSKEKVVKINSIIELKTDDNEVVKIYTAFLFHKLNPDFEKLLIIYSKLEDLLNAK